MSSDLQETSRPEDVEEPRDLAGNDRSRSSFFFRKLVVRSGHDTIVSREEVGGVSTQEDRSLQVRSPRLEITETPQPRLPLLPALPVQKSKGISGIVSFVLLVVAPVAAAIWYFYFVAAPQYVSEFRFAVTQTSTNSLSLASATQGGAQASQGMSGLLGSLGVPTMASTQNYIVADYLQSRQVIDDVGSRIDLVKLYSSPNIDWLARFDPRRPIEQFVSYWQTMVTSRYDPITGIATAEVRAFSASDAQLIAKTLVKLSEALVNRIDMRSKIDSVQFAEKDVQRAENRVKAARAAISDFRIAQGVIDPTTSLVQGNVQDTATVRATLIQLKTQLSTLKGQNLTTNSPIATVLRAQIRATEEQLQQLEKAVANKNGNVSAITSVMKQYEQLELERQYAQNLVISSMAELDQARSVAGQQSLYLTPYVLPSLPNSPVYPRKLQSVLIFALGCFCFWITLSLLYRAIRDRY